MAKIQSVEPNVADLANGWMRSYKLDYKLEQESLNTEIDRALDEYFSKNGGVGCQAAFAGQKHGELSRPDRVQGL